MKPLNKVIINKDTSFNPIWIMRQAGRYLPEFRKIRKKNPNFINLCLNGDLSSEITLQPLKRFDLDAAIIFSDILMLPYGLGQKVEFEKNFGPKLGELNLNEIVKTDEIDFVEKIHRVYKAIKKVSSDTILNNKNTIGFVGYNMIAGGAIGNVIDRVIHGKVIDFIDVHYKAYHWPAFNMADSFIFIGVLLFLYNELIVIRGKKNV